MQEFLEQEEKKIRDKYGEPDRSSKPTYPPKQYNNKSTDNNTSKSKKEYDIEITPDGVQLQKSLNGEFKIVKETEGNYQNFIHLWIHLPQKTYIGNLHKITGKFKLKAENLCQIKQMGIKEKMHFKIVENTVQLPSHN